MTQAHGATEHEELAARLLADKLIQRYKLNADAAITKDDLFARHEPTPSIYANITKEDLFGKPGKEPVREAVTDYYWWSNWWANWREPLLEFVAWSFVVGIIVVLTVAGINLVFLAILKAVSPPYNSPRYDKWLLVILVVGVGAALIAYYITAGLTADFSGKRRQREAEQDSD